MFKAPFSFEGRIRRTEYGISAIIFVVAINLMEFLTEQYSLLDLLYIPLLCFIVAQGTKRCHDKGKEGCYQIIPFYIFTLIFSEGDKEQNEYGTIPKVLE